MLVAQVQVICKKLKFGKLGAALFCRVHCPEGEAARAALSNVGVSEDASPH